MGWPWGQFNSVGLGLECSGLVNITVKGMAERRPKQYKIKYNAIECYFHRDHRLFICIIS